MRIRERLCVLRAVLALTARNRAEHPEEHG